MSSEADRTPAEIAAEGMRADLLRNNGDHGCRVPVSEHLNAVTISGHVDLIALGRAALSALENAGWVLAKSESVRADEREACAKIAHQWCSLDFLKLHAGEMTAQESRTAIAIANAIASAIRSRGDQP